MAYVVLPLIDGPLSSAVDYTTADHCFLPSLSTRKVPLAPGKGRVKLALRISRQAQGATTAGPSHDSEASKVRSVPPHFVAMLTTNRWFFSTKLFPVPPSPRLAFPARVTSLQRAGRQPRRRAPSNRPERSGVHAAADMASPAPRCITYPGLARAARTRLERVGWLSISFGKGSVKVRLMRSRRTAGLATIGICV